MIELAPEETLTWSPPWMFKRAEDRAANKSALIAITGDPEPELLADLDGERVGRARPVELIKRIGELTSDQPNNWCVISYPNEGWAETIFGEPDVERLWEALSHAVRLDEDDPVAAWAEHVEKLQGRSKALNDRHFDAVRFRGPGTDLTIGLLTEVELGRRRRHDQLGPALHRERPDRGGLSRPRTGAGPRAWSARLARSS